MPLRERLEQGLKQAMKERDRPAVSAIKSALSAIDNAGAVDADSVAAPGPGFAPDVARRELTEDEVAGIVRAEADELRAAAEEYEGYGAGERVEELRAGLAALAPYIDPA